MDISQNTLWKMLLSILEFNGYSAFHCIKINLCSTMMHPPENSGLDTVLVTIFGRVNRPSWASVCKSCRFADFPPCVYLGAIRILTWRASGSTSWGRIRMPRAALVHLGKQVELLCVLEEDWKPGPSLLLWHGFAKLLSLYVVCVYSLYIVCIAWMHAIPLNCILKSQRRQISCDITYTQNLKKCYKWTYLQK